MLTDSGAVDELDLRLLHALQLSARVSWSRLQDVLEVDASTLSRRWKRLHGEGLAWVFMHASDPAREVIAFVEVSCRPGSRDSVAATLGDDPSSWTIEFTTGRRDILVTVGARSLRELDRYVDERIASAPGVTSTRTHVIRRTYRDGSHWRLDALSTGEQRALGAENDGPDAPLTDLSPFESTLLRALAEDGRRSTSSIAAELSRSESTVARGIDRVLGSDKGHLRCDMAQDIVGWPFATALLIDVPQTSMPSLVRGLAAMPTTRGCSSIAGPSNLLCNVWMHHLDELDVVEEQIAQRWPEARIDDRWMVTHFAKRMGHILGDDGRRTRSVVAEYAVLA